MECETDQCENGGAGGFFEIHAGSDCSNDVKESEIFRPAGVMCCHLTATV